MMMYRMITPEKISPALPEQNTALCHFDSSTVIVMVRVNIRQCMDHGGDRHVARKHPQVHGPCTSNNPWRMGARVMHSGEQRHSQARDIVAEHQSGGQHMRRGINMQARI